MKQSLGRGLEALIPVQNKNIEIKDIIEIHIEKIIPLKDQPRQYFDKEKIEELSNSIKEKGIIQPIIVRKKDNLYQLVAGERRYQAAKLLNISFIPAIIRNYTDNETYEISLIENIQRENLSPIELAKAYKKIINEYNLTHEELGKKLGKSRTTITNTLRLLELPDYVVSAIETGEIKEGHIRTLISIENEEVRKNLFEKIIREKLTTREIENITKTIKPGKKATNKHLSFNEYKQIIINLEERYGTKVEIKPYSKKSKNGKITLHFFNENDFNRIYSELLKWTKIIFTLNCGTYL